MTGEDQAGFQFLADNSTDIICRAGLDMVLRYVSPSSLAVLGWTPEEMVGQRTGAFVYSEDACALPIGLPLRPDTPSITVRMQTRNGLTAWVEVKHHLVCDPVSAKPREIVIVMRDITERRALEERLAELLLTDEVTGLPTRRSFDETLDREWNRTQRERSGLSLLLLDFNGFSQFHDWREHLEGDSCLPKAAAAVVGALRASDFAARYDAETIAVLLPSTGPGGATRVAQKVRTAIEGLRSPDHTHGASQTWVTVSIGISTVFAGSGGAIRMPNILLVAAQHALDKARLQEAESHGQLATGYSPETGDWKKSMPDQDAKCA